MGAQGNGHMNKPSKTRTNKMKRLSSMIDPMITPSAKARGFAIGRILSHWHDIVGDMASWCRPDTVSFPRDRRTDGTLKLKIDADATQPVQQQPECKAAATARGVLVPIHHQHTRLWLLFTAAFTAAMWRSCDSSRPPICRVLRTALTG